MSNEDDEQVKMQTEPRSQSLLLLQYSTNILVVVVWWCGGEDWTTILWTSSALPFIPQTRSLQKCHHLKRNKNSISKMNNELTLKREKTFFIIVLLPFLFETKSDCPLEWVVSNKGVVYPERLDARQRARLPEQAHTPGTLQQKRAGIHQEAGEHTTQYVFRSSAPPAHAAVHTHHGTSPNSGRYCLGKLSNGTPKTFAPLRTSLSFLFSRRFTEIP